MKNKVETIGVDVSSKKLSICQLMKNGAKRFKEIPNQRKNILSFIDSLNDFTGKVILESTGRYHLLAALLFCQGGMEACVINPLISKKYSISAVRKVKTDKQDSLILAQIGKQEERLKAFDSSENDIGLQKKIALVSSLDKQLQKMKASLGEFRKTKETLALPLSSAEKAIEGTVLELEKRKRALEKEIEDSRDNDPTSKLFSSIPGVSIYLAAICCHMFSKKVTDSPKQWVAFCRLDVSVSESGAWKGKGKLTKRGNAYLRKKLFQSAWGAAMNDTAFNRYYLELKDNGRHHFEALNIIARKIVRIMFVLSKEKTMYDPKACLFNC